MSKYSDTVPHLVELKRLVESRDDDAIIEKIFDDIGCAMFEGQKGISLSVVKDPLPSDMASFITELKIKGFTVDRPSYDSKRYDIVWM